MIANRFVEDAISLDGNEPTARSMVALGLRPGSARRLHASGMTHAESLSNRVSFFIDDAVTRADSECELRREREPSPLPRRGGGGARSKVSRHHSDLSAVRRPSRLQRRRSASRRPLARHESLERGASLRSTAHRVRRQDSAASSSRAQPTAAVLLPHKDLPPKERRRRIAVLIVLMTCLFIVTCSVLAVIVTLTHESFQSMLPDQNETAGVRKQNEQHQNSLSREEGVAAPFNLTSASAT
ncbi:uncharacterized protein LOC134527801 isoform X2 [Bacillus rossius redtenbacheri]